MAHRPARVRNPRGVVCAGGYASEIWVARVRRAKGHGLRWQLCVRYMGRVRAFAQGVVCAGDVASKKRVAAAIPQRHSTHRR